MGLSPTISVTTLAKQSVETKREIQKRKWISDATPFSWYKLDDRIVFYGFSRWSNKFYQRSGNGIVILNMLEQYV